MLIGEIQGSHQRSSLYTNLQCLFYHLVSPFANFFSWVFLSSRPSLAATLRAKETLELPENILMLGIITPVNRRP